METTKQPVLVFYSYDEKDKVLRDQLDTHLATLKRQQLIEGWHDQDIRAGMEWRSVVNQHLNAAQIILLLISADFIASDYRYSVEMKRALDRHDSGDAFVIPVLLRSCDIDAPPFNRLDFLPENKKPIISEDRSDIDGAFLEVARGIRHVIEEWLPRTKEQWLDEGIRYRRNAKSKDQKTELYKKALVAYERALRLDANYARAYRNKGDILYELSEYAKALDAYTLALRLDPSSARAHRNMAYTLWHLGQYNASLDAYDCALRLEATPRLWYEKGDALFHLELHAEALQAYEQALRLDPDFAYAHNNKGNVLLRLKRYSEAVAAYEQTIRLQPTFALPYNNKGRTLFYLGHYQEACNAYEQALQLDPKLTAAYTNLAETLEKLGRIQEAALVRAKAQKNN